MSETLFRKMCDFLPPGQSQALGKGVCGDKLPRDDMELWEGVPFPELVLDRLSL